MRQPPPKPTFAPTIRLPANWQELFKHARAEQERREKAYKYLHLDTAHCSPADMTSPFFREYSAFVRRNGAFNRDVIECPFCQSTVSNWISSDVEEFGWEVPSRLIETTLALCGTCGWYRFHITKSEPLDKLVGVARFGKDKYVTSPTPLIELEQYLSKNWNERKELTAERAETLIADVFKQFLNCEVIYTTNGVYAPDGGIDFVLINTTDGIEYAFQVKRRLVNSPERVHEVREFIGSVASSHYKHAYYVTTAERFTNSAKMEVERNSLQLVKRDIDLILVDGQALRRLLMEHNAIPGTIVQIKRMFAIYGEWIRSGDVRRIISRDAMISETFGR